MLFALVVHSVHMSEYGDYTAQARDSPLDSGVTNKVFSFKADVWQQVYFYVDIITTITKW